MHLLDLAEQSGLWMLAKFNVLAGSRPTTATRALLRHAPDLPMATPGPKLDSPCTPMRRHWASTIRGSGGGHATVLSHPGARHALRT